uniref:G_PROTEIN_RECEP_F1_2 domain-containing protein n=1 Tax=Parastrongyloides trichosuri TaxID=131310 RepID=A0A0N4Z0U8_PARTI
MFGLEKKYIFPLTLCLRIINCCLTITASIIIYNAPGSCLYFKKLSNSESTLIGCTKFDKTFTSYDEVYHIYTVICMILPLLTSLANLIILILLKCKCKSLSIDQLVMHISISVVVYLISSIVEFVIYATFPEAIGMPKISGHLYYVAVDGYLISAIIYFACYVIAFFDLVGLSKRNFGITFNEEE